MTQELNPVSSTAAAWLEKLELSGFLTPAQLAAVIHLNPKSRSTVGTISTWPHYFPLRSPQTHSAYEESVRSARDAFAPSRRGHNFPLIPGNSRVFPVIPRYFGGARGTQTTEYKGIMKRKTSCGVPIQKISPNLHVIDCALCTQKPAFLGAVPPKKYFP
jgi:hypothetical protein